MNWVILVASHKCFYLGTVVHIQGFDALHYANYQQSYWTLRKFHYETNFVYTKLYQKQVLYLFVVLFCKYYVLCKSFPKLNSYSCIMFIVLFSVTVSVSYNNGTLIAGYRSQKYLTQSCLKVPLEIVVWIYDTFENKLRFQNYFTTYLKESCCWWSD